MFGEIELFGVVFEYGVRVDFGVCGICRLLIDLLFVYDDDLILKLLF